MHMGGGEDYIYTGLLKEMGWKHLPALVRRYVHGVPVQFISTREPFTYY